MNKVFTKCVSKIRLKRGQCYKTFYVCNLRMFVASHSICPWQAFWPSLMFAGKAKSPPKSRGFEWCIHIMILVYFTVGSTSSGSAFVIGPNLGAQTIFESISLWRQLLPLYFLIRFPDQISHTFVLFKDVTLTWIDYLETWLRSDNTSCYYTSLG